MRTCSPYFMRSLRDALKWVPSPVRGLKPTATFIWSLRDTETTRRAVRTRPPSRSDVIPPSRSDVPTVVVGASARGRQPSSNHRRGVATAERRPMTVHRCTTKSPSSRKTANPQSPFALFASWRWEFFSSPIAQACNRLRSGHFSGLKSTLPAWYERVHSPVDAAFATKRRINSKPTPSSDRVFATFPPIEKSRLTKNTPHPKP